MDATTDTRSRLRRDAFVAGAVMCGGAAIGVLGQVYGMLDSYRTIGAKAAPTPDDLAVGVRMSLASWIVGGVVGILGAIMLVRALGRINRFDRQAPAPKREPWN